MKYNTRTNALIRASTASMVMVEFLMSLLPGGHQ